MKQSLFILLLAACTLASAERTPPPPSFPPPWAVEPGSSLPMNTLQFTPSACVNFLLQGHSTNDWFSPERLRGICDIYRLSQGIDYELTNSEMSVVIFDGDPKKMVEVVFFKGLGKPSLLITLDHAGKVINHYIGIAICGLGDDAAQESIRGALDGLDAEELTTENCGGKTKKETSNKPSVRTSAP